MKKKRLFMVGAVAVTALLGGVSIVDPAPLAVWNPSASAPRGLYVIIDRAPQIGDYALLYFDDETKDFAAVRGFLPGDIPAIKKIAASNGDEICRRGGAIFINEKKAALALEKDSQGRPMPVWSGCVVLGDDEFFVLNDHPGSFDGRYIGMTKRGQIVGVAILVWRKRTGAE